MKLIGGTATKQKLRAAKERIEKPSKKTPSPTTIDFETFGIQGRPHYPPFPVGVSIKERGGKSKYYAFGHLTNNNSSWGEAKRALEKALKNPDGVLFQNGKFDIDVMETHFELKAPSWEKIHDTLFLLFLDDPNQIELGLKKSAERLLGMPPDEQDVVAEWLLANQPLPGVKISKSKKSDHYFMKYLAFAPGNVVGGYADGDVIRTEGIFQKLYPKTVKRDMLVAYNRERELMPIFLHIERQGIPIDVKRLKSDISKYEKLRDDLTAWIIKRLKGSADLNLDSGEQLVKALVKAGLADVDLLGVTATGKYKSNKDALKAAVTDKQLAACLKYRTQLNTCLNTFMNPWLLVAEQSGGLIFTTWNQTKSSESAGGNTGARTGRLSSTPNFQNMPKEFNAIFAHEESDKKKAAKLPKSPFPGMLSLPNVRMYIIPFEGEALIDRDYSQQEPRILAHFDGGSLMDKYLEDNWIDFHDYARDELAKMGKFYERKPVKNTNLGLIYGMGVAKLAERNEMEFDESKELKRAILELYPGLKEMYKTMKQRAKDDVPIRTWGGREYYCEPPRLVDGFLRKFDYKLVNVLIQGSAADCTKEAIIRLWKAKDPRTRMLLFVHDQITCSTPIKLVHQEMEVLRSTMESVEFDVPILSEGSYSKTNWASLIDYDTKGKRHAIKI